RLLRGPGARRAAGRGARPPAERASLRAPRALRPLAATDQTGTARRSAGVKSSTAKPSRHGRGPAGPGGAQDLALSAERLRAPAPHERAARAVARASTPG